MTKRQTIKNYVHETQLFKRRLWFVAFSIAILSLCLIGRLFYLQIIQRDLYTTLSRENQFNLIPIEPNRGLIYDRNGVLLAENIPVFNLEIIPDRVKNMDAIIAELQKIIAISPDDIMEFKKSLKQHHSFESVPLKIKLTEDEVAKFYVDQYRYPGVAVNARLMRYYPMKNAMSSVLGYVGRINEDDLKNIDTANYAGSNYIGKTGIEKYYEQALHGTVGYQQVEINANGRIVRTVKRIPTIPGDTIYLTIDSNLQLAAEQALGTISGSIVVIQPSTGQILALVNNPSYDPNIFVNGISAQEYQTLQNEPERPLFNRSIRGQFPIASTIKPFMAIAGLETGVITPKYTISDPGWFKLPGNNHVYHDWVFPRNHGAVNVVKAIMVSCDTFFFGLGVKLGVNAIDDNLGRFGFGRKTNIDMPDELPGLVGTPGWKQKTYGAPWYLGDTVSASIGQGYMLSTPLQLAQAVAIMANRGNRYKPILLYKIQKPDNTSIPFQPITESPVVLKNPQTWQLAIKGMADVTTNPNGTAYPYWHTAPYTSAGKTGTAQLYRRPPGKLNQATIPYNLRNHSLFVAFAPIDNPQIAIAVVAEHSLTPASVIARKVVDYYLLTQKHGEFNIPSPLLNTQPAETQR